MLEIDPGLDSKLRTLYEHIEAQGASHALAGFEAPRTRPRRRTLNLIAAVVGVAVLAAAIVVFATELASRQPEHPAPAASPSAAFEGLPKPTALTAELPAISHVAIPVTRGVGSVSLPTFTPTGLVFITWSCTGSGPFGILSTDQVVSSYLSNCASGGNDDAIAGIVPTNPALYTGEPLSLRVTAGASVAWEIVVAELDTTTPLPALGGASLPAGAHILITAGDGTGTRELGAIAPTVQFYVRYACTGTGTIDFTSTGGTGPWARESCANGVVGTQVSAKPSVSGPVNVTVEAAPTALWEVLIYEVTGPTT
jgi:hypothetical protein